MTPEERAVIEAAKKWHEAHEPASQTVGTRTGQDRAEAAYRLRMAVIELRQVEQKEPAK